MPYGYLPLVIGVQDEQRTMRVRAGPCGRGELAAAARDALGRRDPCAGRGAVVGDGGAAAAGAGTGQAPP
ncbi:hypothetical protein ACN24L_38125 [Streptomyces microflavus]